VGVAGFTNETLSQIVKSRSLVRHTFYKTTLLDENAKIENWMTRPMQTHKRWGFGLCFYFLHNTKGFKWNHKRVYLICKELELSLRIKPKSRIKWEKPEALVVLAEINQV